jgi:lipoprotein-anchoring transpeptidase ErfK/SrfK
VTPAWITQAFLPLPTEEKWIEVDLTNQMLYAYEGTEMVFSTKVSTGRANTPTLVGKFRIKTKLESQTMSGAGYFLPGVPYVQYFVYQYALHGAYWHNNWGTPMSHGCVNLRREDAKWLYDWTDPKVPAGAKSVAATASNPGTWVVVHK